MKSIILKNLAKHYTVGSTTNRVLENLDLTVKSGKVVTIKGPSGSGKTTLLKILGTLEKFDEGDYTFFDNDIASMNEKGLCLFRNKQIGFVYQFHQLLDQCTVLENVLIPCLAFAKKTSLSQKNYAIKLLNDFEIAHLKDRFPHEISGGESQRVAIARALINKPNLVLADEPTGSLDHDLSLQLAEILLDINQKLGTTIIVATHSNEVSKILGNIFILKSGKLIQSNE